LPILAASYSPNSAWLLEISGVKVYRSFQLAQGGPLASEVLDEQAELIDVLTDKLGTDRRQATAAVENVVDTIVRAVHKGDSVTITASAFSNNAAAPPVSRATRGQARRSR